MNSDQGVHQHEGVPLLKLPVRTRILNAAAVLSGQHGVITRQAQESECRRETVYEHARKVAQRLAPESGAARPLAELGAENRRLRQVIAEHRREAEDLILCDQAKQRQLATTAFAMGLSLRQIEEVLRLLLPATKAPDHSTLGHWVEAEAEHAGEVLAVLDTAWAPRVQTLGLDEIFFGGDRPWWVWNRPA